MRRIDGSLLDDSKVHELNAVVHVDEHTKISRSDLQYRYFSIATFVLDSTDLRYHISFNVLSLSVSLALQLLELYMLIESSQYVLLAMHVTCAGVRRSNSNECCRISRKSYVFVVRSTMVSPMRNLIVPALFVSIRICCESVGSTMKYLRSIVEWVSRAGQT